MVGRREFEVRDGRAKRAYKEPEVPFDNNAYSAEWHRRNPGKRHEYYAKTHPKARTLESLNADPRMLERTKRWAKEHSEASRHISQIRRARKRGIPGSPTLKQWQDLCAKFQNRCVCCGKFGKLTRDHIIPISNPNSSHDISNIQPLCYSRNSSKNNRFSVDYRKTPFIRSGQNLLFG